jgi:hypothetical protein
MADRLQNSSFSVSLGAACSLGQTYERDGALNRRHIDWSPHAIGLPQMGGSEMRMVSLNLRHCCLCLSQLTGEVRVARQSEQSPYVVWLKRENLF